MDEVICQWSKPAARLRVTGEDAAVFLQGQFSNDLRRSEPSPATYGLWLNHKGRALADSVVLQHGPNVFEVVSRTSPAAAIRERLETYIIADDVALDDCTAGQVSVTLAGSRATAVTQALVGGHPLTSRSFVQAGQMLVVPARCDRGPSWSMLMPEAEAEGLRALLAARGVNETEAAAMDFRRISAGLPVVPDELGPEDLPMEGGLDHDAISFTKGCYLGQEVMARLHNLGQVRRRLFVVSGAGDLGEFGRGAALYSGAQKVGELRSCVPTPSGSEGEGGIGLAMLQVHAVVAGQAVSLTPGGLGVLRVERMAEGKAP